MDWVQVLTIIGANVGLSLTLFLWLRKESNAERREFTKAIIDFHGRLCSLEERYQIKRHGNH